MSSSANLVYYELGWSILSTIGIGNVLFGLLVAGITTFSPVSLVPIITSAAGAVANGLCYYAYYDESYSLQSKAVAGAFGDILWMVRPASSWSQLSRPRLTPLRSNRSRKPDYRSTAMSS